MRIAVVDQFDVAVEVDTERYESDSAYRDRIHEALGIADGQEPLDWDYICATEEELAARGEKPIFSTADYPDAESANEALKQFLDRLFAEDCDEIRAAN
jgi:hypothetical protein